MLNFQCKFCDTDIQSNYAYIGEFVQCPICDSYLIVPDPILPCQSDYHGYKIESMRASTLLWNTYEVSSTGRNGKKVVSLLRIPGTFFLKRISNFDEFANVVIQSGSIHAAGIPKLKDYSLVNGKVYFIFEFFRSHNLESFITKNGPLDPNIALDIVRNVAESLNQVWNKNAKIHQNLLPNNIRLNNKLESKIMNIGLSRYLLQDHTLLELGFNIWDQRYMSPEFSVSGVGDSPLCDIYALGAILYYLITGKHPYFNVPSQNIPYSPIPEIPTDIPAPIISIVQLMMAKQTSIRLQNWSEVIERIDSFTATSKRVAKDAQFAKLYSNSAYLTGHYKPIALSQKRRGAITEKIKLKKIALKKSNMSDTVAQLATPHFRRINSTWQKMKRTQKAKRNDLKNNRGLLVVLFIALFIVLPLLFFILKNKERTTKTQRQVKQSNKHTTDQNVGVTNKTMPTNQ